MPHIVRNNVRDESEAVRIWLLGGFRVSVGTRRTIGENDWRLKKAASLVKLLALEPGHRMHQEQIMESLWPELGLGAATNNLRQVLHFARRMLDPDPEISSAYLQRRGELLELCPETPSWVDVEVFEEAATVARHAGDPAAYRAAIELYAGDLLPEDLYEEWTQDRRDVLNRTYLSLLVELAAIYEERAEHGFAIEVLQQALLNEPSHESAHIGLMRIYALSGKRQEALGQYEQLRKALSRELGMEPSADSQRLYNDILEGRSPVVRFKEEHRRREPQGAPRHNLPVALTSFVGRERELAEVKRLLAMTRLLTLTGAGGSGKTRLALEVAKDQVGAYPDGVWLVELAGLSEGELVAQEVAEALGVREQPGRPFLDVLVGALREKKLLLVLDNCEHLIDATAHLVEELLSSCSGLRVLATSREALNLAGEALWLVPSLSVPDPQHSLTVEELIGYESSRLFIERAVSRSSAFVPTEEKARRAVVEICRRLEGIPLAIELAAARVGVLSAEQVAERLDNSLKLLTAGGRTAPPRQRTLKGTLDWSYGLLSEREKALFGRLSVFAGGWMLEAAEAAGAEDGIERDDVLDLISRLVDQSLAVARAGTEEGAPRYRLLEPVRQYGREKLEQSGEAEEIRRRHAELFLAFAERAAPELKGPQQVSWLERLSGEQDNLRTAMQWLLGKGELEMAATLGWELWLYWWLRGHFTEGRRSMEEALAKGLVMATSARAKALFVAGTMADGQGDRRSAEPLLEESLSLFRELGDKRGAAYALGSAGLAAAGQKRHEQGITFLEESAGLFLEVGDRWGAALTLSFASVVWRNRGDHACAKRRAERGLALSRQIGDRQGTSVALYVLAGLAQAEGDYEQAKRLLEEGLKLSVEVGNETNVGYCLEGLAVVAGAEGRVVRAARLWGAAEALLEAIEVTAYIYASDRSLYQSQVVAARARLAEEAFATAWTEGREMSTEQAIEYALSEEDPIPSPTDREPSAHKQPAALTRREKEIANLVGRGLTNRQIAEDLTLSERTVDTHVGRILKKLGLRSREQVASWMTKRPPHDAN